MLKKNYITPVGFNRIKAELSSLLKIERPKMVKTVAWAASNGDRSENADYHYGKKRLREIDSRIRFLTKRIESAEVIDPATLDNSKVVFGSTVTLEKENGTQVTYQIVGEDEIDIKAGQISWKAPLAKALMNKKVDDEILFKKPNSEEYLKVLKIS